MYLTRERLRGEGESAIYYPGVVDREKATVVEVKAGQTRSGLVFRVPRQETYTVRGLLSAEDRTALGAEGATVFLIGLDGRYWRRQAVDFRGSLPLPSVKYFHFENVLPGSYLACALVDGRGWWTKVLDVNVTTHAKFILLELKHKKIGRS